MSVPGIALNAIRSVTELLGYELVVELSEHSIEIDLERPNKDTRAWDSSLYKSGNVFLEGYANPIKPGVEHNENLENHDKVTVEEGEGEETEDTSHVSVISSSRFQTYMQQDLISQLLTPNEQWKLIAYGVLAVAGLQFVSMIITLYATGSF